MSKGREGADEDSVAELGSAGFLSESVWSKEGDLVVGDVAIPLPTFNVSGEMQTEKQTRSSQQEGIEEVDAPKGKQKFDVALLNAKSVHKWFRYTHFGSDLLANVRDLLLLFAQLANFSDRTNPFVKFFQTASEDILPGLDVFVSLFAVEMDTVPLLDHLVYETLDMRRKCWQAIVNSQQGECIE